jgi:hypothetical protein
MADNSTVTDTESELYLLFGATGMYEIIILINTDRTTRSFSCGRIMRNWADLMSAEPIWYPPCKLTLWPIFIVENMARGVTING